MIVNEQMICTGEFLLFDCATFWVVFDDLNRAITDALTDAPDAVADLPMTVLLRPSTED